MKVITAKNLLKTKKPIQVYFDQDTALELTRISATFKVPVAEYIRDVVKKDIEQKKEVVPKVRKWKSYKWGLNIKPEEIDSIAYKL